MIAATGRFTGLQGRPPEAKFAQTSLSAREQIAHAACKVVRALEIFGSRSLDTFMPPTTSDDDITEHLPHGVGDSWELVTARSVRRRFLNAQLLAFQ